MGAPSRSAAERELTARLGGDAVLPAAAAQRRLGDETEGRGLRGRADAVVVPATAAAVADCVAWCYAHDVAIVPRGGGTGFAGGAVPLDGGVVIGLERLTGVRALDPLQWRACVEAGLPTAHLHRLARENGLRFPPDPGAAEQSQIGGNVATNAGGPHAFKYGVTGAWVTGLEAVVAPGETVAVGGPVRKDVSGYDLRGLLVGSEGTLGIVTAAWVRLIPAAEAAYPVVARYPTVAAGAAAIDAALASGAVPAALEYLDGGALAAAGGGPAAFMVIAEADGGAEQAARERDLLAEALADGALAVETPLDPREIGALWRWRDGVSIAVTAARGAKVSEDVAVPVDRLAEAVEATVEIGRRHGLEACSWGHAGDGNLHSTFMVERGDAEQLARAEAAADELFALAVELGGTVSGEHGIGWVKRGQAARQWNERTIALQEAVRSALDPKGLFNPGKKVARVEGGDSERSGGRGIALDGGRSYGISP